MLKGSHHPTEKNQTYACWTWFQFLGQFCPTQEHLCLAILTWWAHESYKGEDSCTALWYLVSLGSICRINPSAVTLWLLIWSWHIVWVLKFGSCPNTEIFPSHSTFTLGYMISTIAAIASVLLQFFSTTSTDILLESQWGCPHVLLPSDYRKETVGSASAKAVDDCGWMKVHFQCHCTVAAEPQRPTCWGWGPQDPDQQQDYWQLRMVGVHPCAQRQRHPVSMYLQSKGKRWLFFILFSPVQGEPHFGSWHATSFLLCFFYLSFSLCSAKIVSVTHLYPAGKVTCGQCCKTPGGSCGCCTEMTYVKVTKYTQKLWRRKVWFQRKLSHASRDKRETRLLAPHGSFHGTGLLTVSPQSP